MHTMTEPLIVAEAALMAAGYSVLVYSRKYSTHGEDFRPYKFAATVAVGILVGVGMALSGQEVTQAELFARLTALAGTVVILENIIKLVVANAKQVSS